MAPSYDRDLVDLRWDPVAFLQQWPLVVPPGATVLDAGCGTGAVLEHLAGAGRETIGFDVSPAMVDIARRRRPLKGSRLEVASAGAEWPFTDDSVDLVLSLAMLEFVESLDVALDELHRVLRSAGRALITFEDLTDWSGQPRDRYELRYGELPLWRRSVAEVELMLPPGLRIVRQERVRGYDVLELGFTTAYVAVELVKE
jgi:ubiquinone/menaquinone biosynthesis C-methylase UbiE